MWLMDLVCVLALLDWSRRRIGSGDRDGAQSDQRRRRSSEQRAKQKKTQPGVLFFVCLKPVFVFMYHAESLSFPSFHHKHASKIQPASRS
jgi:hypothetical protein